MIWALLLWLISKVWSFDQIVPPTKLLHGGNWGLGFNFIFMWIWRYYFCKMYYFKKERLLKYVMVEMNMFIAYYPILSDVWITFGRICLFGLWSINLLLLRLVLKIHHMLRSSISFHVSSISWCCSFWKNSDSNTVCCP